MKEERGDERVRSQKPGVSQESEARG